MPMTRDDVNLAQRALVAWERVNAAITAINAGTVTDTSVFLSVMPPVVVGPTGSTSQPKVEFTLDKELMPSFLNYLTNVKRAIETRLTALSVEIPTVL